MGKNFPIDNFCRHPLAPRISLLPCVVLAAMLIIRDKEGLETPKKDKAGNEELGVSEKTGCKAGNCRRVVGGRALRERSKWF